MRRALLAVLLLVVPAPSRAGPTAWYTIETEHFAVHYPVSRRQDGNPWAVGPERSARKVAEVAEQVWPRVTGAIGHRPDERIHIVLRDRSDELEGFTVPSWNRITLGANPGSWLYRMRGRTGWLGDALAHELAHVVSLKRSSPFAGHLQGIGIGVRIRDGVLDQQADAEVVLVDAEPSWWVEGGAEFWADAAGYTRWSPSRDANLRTTVLDDRLLGPDEWTTAFDEQGLEGERAYQQGYAFALYLRERFGPETFARLGERSSERWRLRWDGVVEEVTGVPLEELHRDHVAMLERRYEAQRAEIRALGEVDGEALLLEPEEGRLRRDREEAWDFYPRYSGDGRWFAESAGDQLVVRPVPERSWHAIAGDWPAEQELRTLAEQTLVVPVAFGHAFDFVPGRDAVVVTSPVRQDTPAWHPSRPGDFKQLVLVDLAKEEVRRRTPIPNTMRGTDPAVSPDGTRVAFLQYEDGAQNLAVAGLDGSDKRVLTSFDGGTWMQGPDWSPDGARLVVAIFRNHQQDLYLVEADGSGVVALNRDRWEDMDAHWAQDGSLWFASDPGGIFDIYRYDPASRRVHQMTRVVGAAWCPWVTPAGHLLYMGWTAHGWESFAVRREDLLWLDVTGRFGLDPDAAEVARSLAYREDLSHLVARPYRWTRALMPVGARPLLRLDNPSRTRLGLSAGLQLVVRDHAEKHGGSLLFLLGEAPVLVGRTFHRLGPGELGLVGYHAQARLHGGGDVVAHRVRIAGLEYGVPWNEHLRIDLRGRAADYARRDATDAGFRPVLRSLTLGAGLTVPEVASVRYGHGFTVHEDGRLPRASHYNRLDLAGSGTWPVAPLPEGHEVDLSTRLGGLDRDVHPQDELRAGGLDGWDPSSGNLQPSHELAGYPAFSLSGETLAILSVGYRLPILREVDARVGPLELHDLDVRVGAAAGNVWSYRQTSAGEPGRREVPFLDEASENGNVLLTEASVELRAGSALMNVPWDSFVRVAWGFQQIHGFGDLDGDGVRDATEAPFPDEPERPGPRFYLGLGTAR